MNGKHDTRPPCRLWLGTSGYSYSDWEPRFYPKHIASAAMLSYYAARFHTVELNYTFYGMPQAHLSERMARTTPEGFRFFAKAHRSVTHERDLSGAAEFLEGLAPLREAGKLSGLLLQFPQSFKNTIANRLYLDRATSAFGELKIAVEFRDRSWATEPVFRSLTERGLCLVSVDEPEISTLFPRLGVVTSDIGYVRFHSRNRANWYKNGADRYDYLYRDDELREWVPLLEIIAGRARDLFVYFNNCHRGYAAENAAALREIIRQAGLPVVEDGRSEGPAPGQRSIWETAAG